MSDKAGDLKLVYEVHQALRWYRNELQLARSSLLALMDGPLPEGALEKAIVLRAWLSSGVDRLAEEDPGLADLLRRRFLQGVRVRTLEFQGWSRSTLFRHQHRAVVSLARILLEGIPSREG
jgi:hypothetical protein